MSPTVSVIVPNYNHGPYLRRRIDSILAQTRQDFELILLDDASTDGSREILKSYAKLPNVQVRFNASNSGSPFHQWNAGVREARGEYIWIAESDDAAEPELLERLTGRLEKHPKAGIAYCQSWDVAADETRIGSRREYTRDLDIGLWDEDFIMDGREVCRRFMSLRCIIPNASAVVFRRLVYERAGGANESCRYCGAWLIWARMLKRSDLAFCAEH